jgi:hypothetical protein
MTREHEQLPNEDRANHLAEKICDVITSACRADPELEPIDVVLTLLYATGDVIINIGCEHCRKKAAEATVEMLPRLLTDALAYAKDYHAKLPSSAGSNHTH